MKNSGILFILVSLFLLLPGWSRSQESKVISGVIAYQQQDYKKAMADLDQALYYPEELTQRNLAKAYYYRALTRIYIYNNAVLDNNENMISAHSDAYLDAYQDLKNALKADDGTWEKRIAEEFDDLHKGLEQSALIYLNRGIDIQGNSNDAAYLFHKAIEYANAAESIDDTYLAGDIRGQAYLNMGDYKLAAESFRSSIEAYGKEPPELPDFIQGYVYYRLADISLRHFNNGKESLETVKSGLEFLHNEHERFLNSGNAIENKAEKETRYRNAVADLGRFQLELYLKLPEMKGEGLNVFSKAVENEPGNYDLRVAYASLLETVDMEKAVEQYAMAREIEPSRELAWFNTGVVYYNKAREYYQQASSTMQEDKYHLLMEEAEKYFNKSRPFFTKTIELNPSNLSAISAMKNVSLLLDKPDDYEKYNEMEKALKGN